MQTFRSVGDTLALQTWSGENWCLGRESHRGNNVVHTQRHTPWPMHFWKQASSFLNILQYQTPLAEWLLNQSPHVWFWTRNPLLAEPSSNPHSHPQKPTQTSRLQHFSSFETFSTSHQRHGCWCVKHFENCQWCWCEDAHELPSKGYGQPCRFHLNMRIPLMISNR